MAYGKGDARVDNQTQKMKHGRAASWKRAGANVKASRLPGDGAVRKSRKPRSGAMAYK